MVCASRVPDSHLFGRCPKSIVQIIYNEELLTTTLPWSRKLRNDSINCIEPVEQELKACCGQGNCKITQIQKCKKILECIKIQNSKQILNLQETSIVLFTMSNYKQLACGPKNDSSMMVSCVDKDPASRV